MAQGGIVKFGDWISEGWNLFTKQWQTWGLMGLMFFLPILFFIAIFFFIGMASELIARGNASVILGIIAGALIGSLILLLAISYLMGGMYKAAFKQLRGEPIEFADVWSGGDVFWKITVANILIALLSIVGIILCYFPVFVVAGLTYLTHPIIVRENLNPIDAIKKSKDLAKNDWLMFTLFAFVVSLLAQVGAYACYIGIIFSIPLTYTIGVVAYRDCFEPVANPPASTESHSKACKNCGKLIPVHSNFCDFCGAGQV